MSKSSQSPELALITSLRSDPVLLSSTNNDPQSQLYMLSHHVDRLIDAARTFHWLNAPTLMTISSLEMAVRNHLASTYGEEEYRESLKIRVLVNHDGIIHVTSSPVPFVPLAYLFPTSLSVIPTTEPSWSLRLFPKLVEPSLYTSHKTTHRIVYDDARKSLPSAKVNGQESLLQEVLIMNNSREIMEGSLTTPYFFRRGKWITPAVNCGGNIGTTRRWALEHDLCIEGLIKDQDLNDGEVVWMSNGVRGWGWGKLDIQS